MPDAVVLVVEDDHAIRRVLVDALRVHGYRPREAPDGAAGLAAAGEPDVDLLLLDLLMPKMDGLTVLREIRRTRPDLPVIILTARGEEQDRVRGLRSGADDYVVKPFGVEELIARVQAVLRRSGERRRPPASVEVGGRRIDLGRREAVLPDGSRVALSEREAGVIAYLAAHRDRAVPRDELLRCVWGLDPEGVHTRTIDMTVARLREALGDDPARPRVIVTVRGQGYALAPEDAPAAPREGTP